MVAHDLRGPLTVLDGWLEVVEDSDATEEPALVDDAVRKARESSRRMRQVIEDWLNYTVVRTGRGARRPWTASAWWGEEIVNGRRARSASVTPSRSSSSTSTTACTPSPGLLRQLLDNLVGNAIESAPPPTSSPGCRSPPRPTTSRDGSASRSPTTASACPRGRAADLEELPRPAGGTLGRHGTRAGAHAPDRGLARRSDASAPQSRGRLDVHLHPARGVASRCLRRVRDVARTARWTMLPASRCSGAGRRPSSRRTSRTTA